MTAATSDPHPGTYIALGAIFATLAACNFDPVFIGDGSTAMIVQPSFLESQYRITVERIADDDPAVPAQNGAGR